VVGKLKKSSGTKLLFWNTSVSRGQSEREREREREQRPAGRAGFLLKQETQGLKEGQELKTESQIMQLLE
jgi:hypothetical protein